VRYDVDSDAIAAGPELARVKVKRDGLWNRVIYYVLILFKEEGMKIKLKGEIKGCDPICRSKVVLQSIETGTNQGG
jgi:hypothetical protein